MKPLQPKRVYCSDADPRLLISDPDPTLPAVSDHDHCPVKAIRKEKRMYTISRKILSFKVIKNLDSHP